MPTQRYLDLKVPLSRKVHNSLRCPNPPNPSHPHVLDVNGIYHMFYTGMTVGRCSIGLAISKDGIAWEKQRDAPFLEPGQEEWDRVYAS